MKKKLHVWLALVLALLTVALTPLTAAADVARVSKIGSGTVANGYYYLIPANASNRVLSIMGGSKSGGTTACTGPYAYAARRVFYIKSSTGGTYTIKNKNSGMYLEAKNNTTKTGGYIVQNKSNSLNRQRWYFVKSGSYYYIQSSISKKVMGVTGGSTKVAARVNLQNYTKASKQKWKLVKYTAPIEGQKRLVYSKTVNGKRTLKTYLQNAMVPCGRTLYIWGGGWGDSDASVIGYQNSWNSFFLKNGSANYDYTKFRYQYGKGLDCSGFAAWVLYNTLYTTSGGNWLVWQSTTVASKYAEKGWATLAKNSADKKFKPGDVVSMNGHVWISLGQYSDGSVLLVHSSPKGVQISGTAGKAATKASYYMKKYFPEWPYQARTVSKSYLTYVGKARWKIGTTGAIMKDPDGIQKMSADKVMKLLFGS
ncbi:MAG: RICIN domain-containing protein [Lachnospiraceae bacterium]|nr:RICIN domain-containing protein [Lachnospiraceae bacterium]